MSQNNLTDVIIDYFLFHNQEAISKRIKNNTLTLYIVNNYGIFKEQFLAKVTSKLDKFAIISAVDGVMSFNSRGEEENLSKKL